MTIIYVHGVKVRSPNHGIELGKSFQRWLAPKLSGAGADIAYDPVYWGDLAATFQWKLASRPPTLLLGQGGDAAFANLGALRSVSVDAPGGAAAGPTIPTGPVLGAPVTAQDGLAPFLSTIPPERRADFLADFYLVCRPPMPISQAKQYTDPIADVPMLASLADAASRVAAQWDAIVVQDANDSARAQRLLAAVEAALQNENVIGMGAFASWMTRAGEVLRRAAGWPGDAVSTVFAELRPTLNEFVSYFVGDVFIYLTAREQVGGGPGAIPERFLRALRDAHRRKEQTGEKIVVVSHSMGGQIVYDALTHFAARDTDLADLEVDQWITCGAQVSLFAEMRLFLGQPAVADGERLPMPPHLRAWTNYYDPNDVVGFIMEPVFQGVKDQYYNTGYGLAFAHTGFLARPSFFEAVASRL